MDPEVIICNEKSAADIITANPQWSGIQADRTKGVPASAGYIPMGTSQFSGDTIGHAMDGENSLPGKIYPYKHGRRNQIFLPEFFQIELSDKIVEQILKAEGLRDPK